MSQQSVPRSFHVFVTGKSGGAVGVPGVAQTGAGTFNSDPIEPISDRTLSIVGTLTKTGGTLSASVKVQVSNATPDEVIRSGFSEQWEDEGSVAAIAVGDATTAFVFKITRAIFRRYRVSIVQASGNSSAVARAAV